MIRYSKIASLQITIFNTIKWYASIHTAPFNKLASCYCPGCGAKFQQNSVGAPGYVDNKYLQSRTILNKVQIEDQRAFLLTRKEPATTPSASRPELHSLTRLELERIERRQRMQEGEATRRLAEYNSQRIACQSSTASSTTEPIIHHTCSLSAGSPPIDLADEQIAQDPIMFNELAEKVNATLPRMLKASSTSPDKHLMCARCHQLSFGKLAPNRPNLPPIHSYQFPLTNGDRKIFTEAVDGRALIVKIVDSIDMPLSFIPAMEEVLGISNTLLHENMMGLLVVANKADLLPGHGLSHQSALKLYIQANLPQYRGLQLENVILASAKTGFNIDLLRDTIIKLGRKRGGHVFLVGRTNVGKSRLYNQLLGLDRNNNNATPSTVAAEHGTTAGILRKKLANLESLSKSLTTATAKSKISAGRDQWLFDLPGILSPHIDLVSHHLEPAQAKLVVLDRKAHNLRHSLDSGETGFFGGLFRIEYFCKEHRSSKLKMHCFLRPSIPYFSVRTAKANDIPIDTLILDRPPPLSHAEEQLAKTINDPIQYQLALEFTIESSNSATIVVKEIVFGGSLGWIGFSGIGIINGIVRIYTPNGHGVILRPPLRSKICN